MAEDIDVIGGAALVPLGQARFCTEQIGLGNPDQVPVGIVVGEAAIEDVTVVGELPETGSHVDGICCGKFIRIGRAHVLRGMGSGTGLDIGFHLGPLLAGRRVIVALDHDFGTPEVVRVVPYGRVDVAGRTGDILGSEQTQTDNGVVHTLATAGDGVQPRGQRIGKFAALGLGDIGGRSSGTFGSHTLREADGISRKYIKLLFILV